MELLCTVALSLRNMEACVGVCVFFKSLHRAAAIRIENETMTN